MKRLIVAFFIFILFILGSRTALVTPAFARAIELSVTLPNQTILPSSSQGYGFGIPSLNYPNMLNSVLQVKDGRIVALASAMSLNPALNLSLSSALLKENVQDDVSLSLVGPDQVKLADPIILTGFLKDTSTNTMVSNKTITFSTDGIYLAQTHTDDQGAFTVKINKDLSAGNYMITASFKGAHLLAPAISAVWLQVLPATVRVQTVPAIAGITFQMGDRQFISGQDGLATVNINQAGIYRLDVLLDQYHNPSQQVEFGRWSQESYQPFRDVQVPADDVIQVGLNVFHKISLKFVDLDGLAIDLSRITSISIRSIQGDVFTLKPGDTPWLPSSRTARRLIGLEETDLPYSVNSVIIDGSNVVNSAQQRFYVNTDDTWTISLLLYTLRITAKDGLFGSPIGNSVNVLLPNGQTQNYPLDKSGVLEIHSLARGIYRVSLVDAKGLGTSTPVALSRNQVVNLKIVTILDMAVVGLLGIAFALGLIFYGRPRLLNALLGRKPVSSNTIGWLPKHEN
jgi:hypothetical protein